MHDKLHYTGSECKRIINVCWHNWDLQWAPLELSAFVPRSIKVVWIIKTGPSIIFSLNKFKKKQEKKNDLLHGKQENHRRMSFINGLKIQTLFRGLWDPSSDSNQSFRTCSFTVNSWATTVISLNSTLNNWYKDRDGKHPGAGALRWISMRLGKRLS